VQFLKYLTNSATEIELMLKSETLELSFVQDSGYIFTKNQTHFWGAHYIRKAKNRLF